MPSIQDIIRNALQGIPGVQLGGAARELLEKPEAKEVLRGASEQIGGAAGMLADVAKAPARVAEMFGEGREIRERRIQELQRGIVERRKRSLEFSGLPFDEAKELERARKPSESLDRFASQKRLKESFVETGEPLKEAAKIEGLGLAQELATLTPSPKTLLGVTFPAFEEKKEELLEESRIKLEERKERFAERPPIERGIGTGIAATRAFAEFGLPQQALSKQLARRGASEFALSTQLKSEFLTSPVITAIQSEAENDTFVEAITDQAVNLGFGGGIIAATTGVAKVFKLGANAGRKAFNKAKPEVQNLIIDVADDIAISEGRIGDVSPRGAARIAGGEVPGEAPKIPKDLEPLAEEARKFDTAEEFVEGQGEAVYHGTNAEFDEFRFDKSAPSGDFLRGIYFTNDINRAKQFGKNVKARYVNFNNPFILEKDIINPDGTVAFAKPLGEQIAERFPEVRGMNYSERTDLLKSKGFDGIEIGDLKIAFDDKQIKTKQQLTDFFNQAKGVEARKEFDVGKFKQEVIAGLEKTKPSKIQDIIEAAKPVKPKFVGARDAFVADIQKRIETGDKLPKDFAKKFDSVIGQLEQAQAGQRIFTDEGVFPIKSTFPKFIPEGLRSRKLIDKVLKHINDGTQPELKGTKFKERQLFDVVMGELGKFIPDLQPKVSKFIDASTETLPLKREKKVKRAEEQAKSKRPRAAEGDRRGKKAPRDEPVVTPKEAVAPKEVPEIKVRGLAKGIEQKAVQKKLVSAFEDLPEFQVVKVKEQAAGADKLIKKDYQEAIRVAMGESQPPKGILPESVLVAVEDVALKAGDIDTLRRLATSSRLVDEATTMGQRLRLLAERNPESAVANIQRVAKTRIKAVEAKTRTTIAVAKKNVVKEIKTKVKRGYPTKADWSSFIDNITC